MQGRNDSKRKSPGNPVPCIWPVGEKCSPVKYKMLGSAPGKIKITNRFSLMSQVSPVDSGCMEHFDEKAFKAETPVGSTQGWLRTSAVVQQGPGDSVHVVPVAR